MHCFTKLPTFNKNVSSDAIRAVFMRNKIWPQSSLLNVVFTNGEPWQKAWVEKVITENIDPLVNLTFAWFQTPGELESQGLSPDISILFPIENVAQSSLGTDSKQAYPSMQLGWLDPPMTTFQWNGNVYSVPENVIRNESKGVPITTGATVIHEFGHALGMIHEHQNPFGEPIEWNTQAVIDQFSGPPNNWTLGQIQLNILDAVNPDTHNGSEFDPQSIMIYPVKSDLTLNLSQDITLPSQMSAMDKFWLQQTYPPSGFDCIEGACVPGTDFTTIKQCYDQCGPYGYNVECDNDCNITSVKCTNGNQEVPVEYCAGQRQTCNSTCRYEKVKDCNGAEFCIDRKESENQKTMVTVDMGFCKNSINTNNNMCQTGTMKWSECKDNSQFLTKDCIVYNDPVNKKDPVSISLNFCKYPIDLQGIQRGCTKETAEVELTEEEKKKLEYQDTIDKLNKRIAELEDSLQEAEELDEAPEVKEEIIKEIEVVETEKKVVEAEVGEEKVKEEEDSPVIWTSIVVTTLLILGGAGAGGYYYYQNRKKGSGAGPG